MTQAALVAVAWVVLATALDAVAFTADEALSLHRLPWRVDLAFKRLKTVAALLGPPGRDVHSARAFVPALFLMMLLKQENTGFGNYPYCAIAA